MRRELQRISIGTFTGPAGTFRQRTDIPQDNPRPVANPAGMVRGNAYAATKAALEAHTVNLAAELRGTGVTVNAYRPGGVDTAMQAWIRRQDPDRIGAGLHERFNRSFADSALITPEHSASAMLAHLPSDETGAAWDVSTASAAA
jgi:NAD(P)-dependent dehydrogenase (short-subunit alcohol dehydrogenase family)